MNVLQLTVAILKPHIMKHPIHLEEIRKVILTSNFKIVKAKTKKITIHEAEEFYMEHKDKFFYNRLITFMTSGPSDLYILAKENAIKDWRALMGPTKVFKAQFEAPDTIRGKYGLSDTRNATHGSEARAIPEVYDSDGSIADPEFEPSSINDLYSASSDDINKDSIESARREIGIFFPEFDIDKWFMEEEKLFRSNNVSFCKEHFQHQPNS